MDSPTTPEFSIGFVEGFLESLIEKKHPVAAEALEHLGNVEAALKNAKASTAVLEARLAQVESALRGISP